MTWAAWATNDRSVGSHSAVSIDAKPALARRARRWASSHSERGSPNRWTVRSALGGYQSRWPGSHALADRGRHEVAQGDGGQGVERAVGAGRRVLEPVPVGAVGRGGDVVLPRGVAQGGPALDVVPERHRRPVLVELEVDPVGHGVAEGRAVLGRRHVGHRQVGELEAAAVGAEHGDRRVPDVGARGAGGGHRLGGATPAPEHGDVHRHGPGRDLGGEHGGDRAQPLGRIADLGRHRRRGERGHHPALGHDRAVPPGVDVDQVAPGRLGIGGERHLLPERAGCDLLVRRGHDTFVPAGAPHGHGSLVTRRPGHPRYTEYSTEYPPPETASITSSTSSGGERERRP